VGLFFRGEALCGWIQGTRLMFEHEQNSVADRKRQLIVCTDQFLRGFIVVQCAFAQRAYQNVQQARVHSGGIQSEFNFAISSETRLTVEAAAFCTVAISARTGTTQMRASASVRHFTASFSVIRIISAG